VRARAGGSDVDVLAVESHDRAGVPDVVLLVPDRGLALEVAAWPGEGTVPGATAAATDFAPFASGEPGQPLMVRLPGVPSAAMPVLLRVRAAGGSGGYRVVALGAGVHSGETLLAQLQELEAEGRIDDALLVATAFAHLEPGSPSRAEVLRVAARLAGIGPPKEKGAGPGGPTP
jgi:hypothetical protein